MMDYQLTLPTLLERARRWFPEQQIVSNLPEGIHRYTFRDFYGRVCRLMNVLRGLGVRPGDRVATFAWNHFRHMELYYAVPALGAVLHTLNIRLAPQQLEYIVNNAEDTTIFADADLAPQLVPLLGRIPSVQSFVIMGAADPAATGLAPVLDYETLMADAAEDAEFPEIGEREACMLCYTSGTTGNPKGVLYSHRSQVLQCLIGGMTDNFQFTEGDVMLAIAPMFHVNGWGIPFLCAMLGARPVLPGATLDSATLVRLIREEGVTFTNGVPTIWTGVLDYLREHGGDLGRLERVLIGGAPVPLELIDAYRRDYGVALRQAWGMTETAPPGRPLVYTRSMQALPEAEKLAFLRKSATVGPCEEIKVVD